MFTYLLPLQERREHFLLQGQPSVLIDSYFDIRSTLEYSYRSSTKDLPHQKNLW